MNILDTLLLAKDNPNHDELGRFSSGDSGGGESSFLATKIGIPTESWPVHIRAASESDKEAWDKTANAKTEADHRAAMQAHLDAAAVHTRQAAMHEGALPRAK